MPYADVLRLALYDPDHGFYATTGKAGRRGDFLTSPEVGPLFGQVVSRAIDACWDELGQPDDFTVIDFGAGPGTLARSVLAAEPRCAGALRYLAVETSAAQREEHPEGVESVGELSAERIGDGFTGMVIANELLDNLAFTPLSWTGGQAHFAHVDIAEVVDGAQGALVEVFLLDPERDVSQLQRDRTRFDQSEAAEWVQWVLNDVLSAGKLVVVDYARQATEDVEVRTYSQHGRQGNPLVALGSKDITIDVDLEILQRRAGAPTALMTQKRWLEQFGMSELVDEGKAIWEREAAVGGLVALRAISRVREAEALSDPVGLGGFFVAEWVVGGSLRFTSAPIEHQ